MEVLGTQLFNVYRGRDGKCYVTTGTLPSPNEVPSGQVPCPGLLGDDGEEIVPSTLGLDVTLEEIVPLCCAKPLVEPVEPKCCFPCPTVDEKDIRNVRILPWGEEDAETAWVGSDCGQREIWAMLAKQEPVNKVKSLWDNRSSNWGGKKTLPPRPPKPNGDIRPL